MCFMTFNDFWHISEMMEDDKTSLALWAVARSARHKRERLLTPLCVPLRALGWGYDCFALRALSLRDEIALLYGGRIHRIMQSLVNLCVACTVVV